MMLYQQVCRRVALGIGEFQAYRLSFADSAYLPGGGYTPRNVVAVWRVNIDTRYDKPPHRIVTKFAEFPQRQEIGGMWRSPRVAFTSPGAGEWSSERLPVVVAEGRGKYRPFGPYARQNGVTGEDRNSIARPPVSEAGRPKWKRRARPNPLLDNDGIGKHSLAVSRLLASRCRCCSGSHCRVKGVGSRW